MGNTIDLVNPTIFNPDIWIGHGHKYNPKLLPQEVFEAQQTALSIPLDYHASIPSPDISVTSFLEQSLSK